MTIWPQATFPGIYIVLRTSALSDSLFCFHTIFRASSTVTSEKLKHNNFDAILTCSFVHKLFLSEIVDTRGRGSPSYSSANDSPLRSKHLVSQQLAC